MRPSDGSDKRDRVFVLGLLGAIGAGKSSVAAAFEALGARRIDADVLAHEALETPAAKAKLAGMFDSAIFAPDGCVDRAAVAAEVFEGEEKLKALQDIVHPEVIRRVREQIESADGVVVLDAPLILECGIETLCDALVFVKADDHVRRQRLRDARNWTDDEIRRRERFQLPPGEKENRADYCIDNGGAAAETDAQVRDIWRRIQKAARGA